MFKRYLTFIILIRATCKAWTIGCQASTIAAASLADNSASQPLAKNWNWTTTGIQCIIAYYWIGSLSSVLNKWFMLFSPNKSTGQIHVKELFFYLFGKNCLWQVTSNKMEKLPETADLKSAKNTFDLPASVSSSVSSFRREKNARWAGWTDKATSECSCNHFYSEEMVITIYNYYLFCLIEEEVLISQISSFLDAVGLILNFLVSLFYHVVNV